MNMQVLPAKRQEENCIGRFSKGLSNQNEKHLVNLCEYSQLAIQLGIVNELARCFVLKV